MCTKPSLSMTFTYMNESGSNQDTSTKVLAEEEDFRWDLHPLDFLRNHWEAGAEDGSKEDND
jgi:hypothetical protein